MAQPSKRSEIPIFIVIGNPVESSRIETILTKDGDDVVAFQSAQQLWNNFAVKQPRYIITDRRFPELSGLDLCRRIRENYLVPYVYIHILSRMANIEEIEEALDAGANDYSIKPVSPFQLRARVRVGLRWLHYIDSITISPRSAT
jgi:DNA-binding response OmpR family regulator